jgi:outer membrane protein assembly factor BamB
MKTTAFAMMLSVLILSSLVRPLSAADTTGPLQATSTATLASVLAPNASPLIERPEARKLGYFVVWSATIVAKPGDWIRAFVLGDVMVVVHRPSNQATVLELKNGNPLWNAKVGDRLERVIAAARLKEKILINTEGYMRIYEWDSGRLLAKQALAQRVSTAPVVVGESAVFGGINGMVFAHNIRVGDANWKYSLRKGVRTNPVNAGSNRVFVADTSGYYAMFMFDRPAPLWKGKTFGRISAQPVSSRLGVFFACEDHNIYSLDRAVGTDRIGWPYRTDKTLKADAQPILIDNYLFIRIPGRGLVAIDAARKKDLWAKDMSAKPVAMIKQGMLFDDSTRLLVIDPATGRKRNEASVSKLQEVIPGPKGSLFLLAPDGRVLRMDPLK